ncbi:MAG: hypothetical protein CSA62_15245 [Planctomycetota bacterium]|nr:MAG: hypothetical protein CSA62_15245 [Planctomycetota bacterium]
MAVRSKVRAGWRGPVLAGFGGDPHTRPLAFSRGRIEEPGLMGERRMLSAFVGSFGRSCAARLGLHDA